MSTPKSTNQFLVTTGGNETDARVAVLANGDIAVVYHNSAEGSVRMAILAPDGSPLDDFLISDAADLVADASVAALPDGRYVVSFAIGAGVSAGVYAVVFNGSTVNSLTLPFPSTASDPRVTVLENGTFVVSWQQGDDFGFQIYRPDGTAVGSAGTISTILPAARPEIAALAGGGFVVVGTVDDNNGDPYYFIYNDTGFSQSSGPSSLSGHTEDDAFVLGLANGDFVNVFTRACRHLSQVRAQAR